jgi:HipA-like protein
VPDEGSENRLVVVMDGQVLGSVTQDAGGRLTLEYDQLWRSLANPTPLSLSMPVAVRTHGDPVVRSFLWGLLPDNERVLDRWARSYQVSAANPFALLRHVGEDCAGAGGPSPEQIIELIRRAVRPDASADEHVWRFVDALAFNWIIAGTDAHGKNYSLVLAGDQVRLAPLYDLASALPYDDMFLPRLRMAMRIGGEYRVTGVSGRHWRRFAQLNALDPDATVGRVGDLAARVADCFAEAAQADSARALGSALPARLVERVAKRASDCRTALARD